MSEKPHNRYNFGVLRAVFALTLSLSKCTGKLPIRTPPTSLSKEVVVKEEANNHFPYIDPVACGGLPPSRDNPFCTVISAEGVCVPLNNEFSDPNWKVNWPAFRQERFVPSEGCKPPCRKGEVCVNAYSASLCCGDLNQPEKQR